MTAERVLLLVPARTYRAADFVAAAGRLGLDLVIGSDGALPLGGRPVVHASQSDLGASQSDLDASAARVMAGAGPVAAVVAADTPMLPLAAVLAARMGLPHNPVQAVTAAADKAAQRRLWADARVAQPAFRVVPASAGEDDLRQAAAEVGFPCVVKATSLSASQGVLRADDPAAAAAAARRVRQVLGAAGRPGHEPLVVEEYVPGRELSIDGLLTRGALTVTAIFDKPWAPEGPTFEETLLITPSRLPGPVLAAAISTAEQAARALGLTHGPIHAELRIDGHARPVMLELAARCIGGLCSRALDFGGRSLEELVLAHALGRPITSQRSTRPSGVLMLAVPRGGVLRAVEGRQEVTATPGITGLTITVPVGGPVRPLPDTGPHVGPYLGFIFAAGDTHEQVERALGAARERLRVVIR